MLWNFTVSSTAVRRRTGTQPTMRIAAMVSASSLGLAIAAIGGPSPLFGVLVVVALASATVALLIDRVG
jgi:hypothetical protein